MKLQDLISELIRNHSYDENVSLASIQKLYVSLNGSSSSIEYTQGYKSLLLNYSNHYYIGTQKYLDFCKGQDDYSNRNKDNYFPKDERPNWVKNAVIIWDGGIGFSENWERIFREVYDGTSHIQKYKDHFGHAYLLPKGRVLIYNNESGYSIGVIKE